jgi:ribosomal protein S18 acetylase RimI-like enzyme
VETGNVLTPSAADAAVRPGRAGDGAALGAIQARAGGAAALADAWEEAVTSPPSRRHAVLVATARGVVVGFVAVAPATDADLGADVGEILVLAVDPAHQRGGHGSRLLSAATSTMRDEGVTGVVAWLPLPDAVLRNFLGEAGMVADGGRRTLAAADGSTVTQLRLTAALG